MLLLRRHTKVSLGITQIYMDVLRGSVDMVGDSQYMVTDSQSMLMPQCETFTDCEIFTMPKETFSRSLETMSMSREK
jgi:hypothetical protein